MFIQEPSIARGGQRRTWVGCDAGQHGLCGVEVLGARVAVQLVLQRVLDLGLEGAGDVVPGRREEGAAAGGGVRAVAVQMKRRPAVCGVTTSQRQQSGLWQRQQRAL
jgi:hypothetical protein